MGFERIGGEEVWEGRIAKVRVDRFRYDDGEEAEREIVAHPGAVAVVAHDGERLYLVRQPREAVDEQALLELPAGKLEDEDPLETAKRELAEEIGKRAGSWELLTRFYSSPGFASEQVHVYLATDLEEVGAGPGNSTQPGETERIEVIEAPLERTNDVIAGCSDAKSLVGLLWFRAFHR
jgi:8-oxo-dGTP pyrophosphatase MutT (NUDIX family)